MRWAIRYDDQYVFQFGTTVRDLIRILSYFGLYTQFIPVGQRLPPIPANGLRKKYLVMTDEGIAVSEWRDYADGWAFESDSGLVTHWMAKVAEVG